MAYTDIDKPDDYFNTVLYTGNGGTQSITGVGFKPDFVWLKNRDSGAYLHQRYDFIRGTTKCLFSNTTEEQTISGVTSFNTDGFSIGSDGGTNSSGNKFVSWNWLASNTTGSNTDGSITSTVSANTTSGFSIVSTTGTGSAATIGHGLGVAPAMIIGKSRSTGSTEWRVYNKNLDSPSHILYLNNNLAQQGGNSATWNNTAPTSSVFSVGTSNDVNQSGDTFIFYCFAEKKGFSKFGKYTGNGSTNGPFIYTGFKPAFLLIKEISGTSSWQMNDNKRSPINVITTIIYANSSDAEYNTAVGSNSIDFVSNGWKSRGSNAQHNGSGSTYIYMAFAESPFVTSTGIPTTAR